MQFIRVAAIVLVSLAAVLPGYCFYHLISIVKSNRLLAVLMLMQVITPFLMILSGLAIQRDSKAALFRNLGIITWAAIGCYFAANLDLLPEFQDMSFPRDDDEGVNVPYVWFCYNWLSLVGWAIGPPFLFWSVADRSTLTTRPSNSFQRVATLIGLVVLGAGLLLTSRILEDGSVASIFQLAPLDFRRPFTKEVLGVANIIPFYLIALGMMTTKPGRYRWLMAVFSLLVVIVSFPNPVLGRAMVQIHRPPAINDLLAGYLVMISFYWLALPMFLMLWLLDWASPVKPILPAPIPGTPPPVSLS